MAQEGITMTSPQSHRRNYASALSPGVEILSPTLLKPAVCLHRLRGGHFKSFHSLLTGFPTSTLTSPSLTLLIPKSEM